VIYGPNTPSNPSAQDKVVYLEADTLNTPRKATDHTGKVVWAWRSDAFGSTAPLEDPDGDGQKTTLNLRFPGQYFDAESGLYYNVNRYYDPAVGRYTQPDPIGVAGGLNPCSYAGGNPLSYTDPKGLNPVAIGALACAANPIACAAAGAAVCWGIPSCRQAMIDGGKAICKAADNLIFNRPKNPPDVGLQMVGFRGRVEVGSMVLMAGRNWTSTSLTKGTSRTMRMNGQGASGKSPAGLYHLGHHSSSEQRTM